MRILPESDNQNVKYSSTSIAALMDKLGKDWRACAAKHL
jgi:hypothetical protein